MPEPKSCQTCAAWKPLDKERRGTADVGKCATYPKSNGTHGSAGRQCKGYRAT